MTILSTDLQPHPLGELFPLIEGPEFDALVADIRKHGGLLFPITTYEGQILDGRNRYRACRAANVKPKFESYAGDDPAGFVLSANIARRHLAPEQKRELIRKVLQLKPELSNRQIGEQTQASHPFVGKVRGEMEQAGQLETVSSSIGADGRKRRRKKAKPRQAKVKTPTEEITGVREPKTDAPIRLDPHDRLRHDQDRLAALYRKDAAKYQEFRDIVATITKAVNNQAERCFLT